MALKSSKSPQRGNFAKAAGSRFALTPPSLNPVYLIGVLVLCLCIGLFIWWFRNNFERVTSTTYEPKTEVQYNPYYAAELLINNQYIKAQALADELDPNKSDEGNEDNDEIIDDQIADTLLDSDLKSLLNDLPPLDSALLDTNPTKRPTLIINNIGTKLSEASFRALTSWIEQGGHVITFTSQSVSFEDMKALHERLAVLKNEQVAADDIANDETLANLINELNAGNQFLAQLGIFAVDSSQNTEDELADDADIETQVEAIIAEFQAQDNQRNKSDKDIVSETIARLAADQPLALLMLPESVTMAEAGPTANTLIAVQGQHFGSHLDAELFQALHPSEVKVHRQSIKINTQALLIRDYLQQQQSKISSIQQKKTNDQIKSQSGRSNIDPQTSETVTDEPKLTLLIQALLALPDEKLVALFKPIDDIYLDAEFGKGRISVVLNSDSFTNPNPNIDLPKEKLISSSSADSELTGSKLGSEPNSKKITHGLGLAQATPLYELLNPSFRVTLLNADNAAWLHALTKDSSLVWILPNTDIAPLPIMLWQQARWAVLGFGLLVIIWLWSLNNRFGKAATLPTAQAHDIMRYFRQVGRYGWQQDNAVKLTRVTRDRVWKLVTEQLKTLTNADTHPQLAGSMAAVNPTALSSHALDDIESQVSTLNQLLLARINEKKQMLVQSSATNNSLVVDGIRHIDLPAEDLVANNEEMIKAVITPERLQKALSPTAQDGQTAYEFTQIAQTLWTVQWLLK